MTAQTASLADRREAKGVGISDTLAEGEAARLRRHLNNLEWLAQAVEGGARLFAPEHYPGKPS